MCYSFFLIEDIFFYKKV